MKKLNRILRIFIPVLLLICVACAGTRNTGNVQNMADLKELVNSREFEIENEWALPLGGNMINLITNPNHIRFNGNEVDIFLPYFGVRRAGGGYSGEAGIKLKDQAQNLVIEEEKNGRNLLLRFEAEDNTETFQFFITLFPDGSAHTSVNSTQRDAISYRGYIRSLPEGLR